MKTKGAFTLTELLTVMAIIALLAALIMPAVSRARESSRRAVCSQNLRQIGVACFSYAATYDEKFPVTALNRDVFAPNSGVPYVVDAPEDYVWTWNDGDDSGGKYRGRAALYNLTKLFPDFVDNANIFICPSDEIILGETQDFLGLLDGIGNPTMTAQRLYGGNWKGDPSICSYGYKADIIIWNALDSRYEYTGVIDSTSNTNLAIAADRPPLWGTAPAYTDYRVDPATGEYPYFVVGTLPVTDPAADKIYKNSPNHSSREYDVPAGLGNTPENYSTVVGSGQNILCVGGNVKWVQTTWLPGSSDADNIYRNDDLDGDADFNDDNNQDTIILYAR